MQLKSLRIANFRGIKRLELDFDEKINVFIGINGVGKSAILDCAAIMLSRLIGRIRSTEGTGRYFTLSDIKNGTRSTINEIKIDFMGRPINWRVTKTRAGRNRQSISKLQELREFAQEFRAELEKNKSSILPLAVYYPVNRAVIDIPIRIRKKHPFDRLSAYDQALSGESSNFRIFFEWFREREDLENEYRLDRPKYRDTQLEAVRHAISRFLTGFEQLRIKRSPLRMVVTKQKEELIVNQLSDGEKCTLAMAGDLARRLAIANPHLQNPLEGEAIVLIDEIDLHFHPEWQGKVIRSLNVTFPNCQFLLSTHSPLIVNHLHSGNIWMLERKKSTIVAGRPADSYGQETSRILEDIMRVSSRPSQIKKRINTLYDKIEQQELEEAMDMLDKLLSETGPDPELTRASILIKRAKVIEE